MENKYGIGIAGLGKATMNALPSILHHERLNFAAVADVHEPLRLAYARQYGVEAYATIEELCQSEVIDVVYIATPHQFHAEHAVAAARYGKHVIVEKPMALTMEECDRMIEAAERNGVQLVIGPTHSYDAPIQKIKEIIASGRLGKLKMMHTWNYTNFLYRPRRPEELDTSKGGGIIYNQVPHQMDVLRFIGGGLIRSVRGVTGIWDLSRPTEASMSAWIEFENDVVATAVYSGYDHFDTDEWNEWIGEGGEKKNPLQYGQARKRLKERGGESEVEMKQKASIEHRIGNQRYAHPHFGVLIVSCERGDIRTTPSGIIVYGDDEKEMIPVPLAETFSDRRQVFDEWVEAVAHGRKPLHNGYWGKATLEASIAVLESSRSKKEIYLSQQVAVEGYNP